MLKAKLNKSSRQHPTKHQLHGHQPPITITIKIRRCRHVGHFWRSRDDLISDVLLWIPSQGRAKAGRPTQTYIQQLFVDTGCSREDLLEAIDDREGLAREGQGYPCWWRNMMMMKNYNYNEFSSYYGHNCHYYMKCLLFVLLLHTVPQLYLSGRQLLIIFSLIPDKIFIHFPKISVLNILSIFLFVYPL